MIAVVTGSRADYGLLEPLIEELGADLYVTGSHLSYLHGHTVDEIEAPIKGVVECVLASDSKKGSCFSLSLVIHDFAEILEREKPDAIVGLGDRYEILGACLAAHILNIPIAHIHGGELTAGAMDDAFRHSITKMASIHFTATQRATNRVIQLGEHPDTVHFVGALGCEGLKPRKDWVNKNKAVVLYHPVTLGERNCAEDIAYVLTLMGIFHTWIGSNCDPGWSNFNGDHIKSVNRDTYLSMLSDADFIIGNSSSGIIEAPALGIPSINIGDRQQGREQATSVIQADPIRDNIEAAIEKVYSRPFQRMMRAVQTPYVAGDELPSKAIAEILQRELSNIRLKKGFHDLP